MRLSILDYVTRLSARPTRAENSVEWQNGSRSVVESGTKAAARPHLVHFNRRVFAVFDAALFSALFTESGDAQVPNLVVDLAKCRLGELVRRRYLFLEAFDTFLCALDLIGRQSPQNSVYVFDFRNAMTDHGQIVSSPDGEPNCFFQSVTVQDRAHVEIIGHDQSIEAEFLAQEIGNDAAR